MKLPAYPRTKPSGVEWLGDVPEHWSVKAIKWETPVLRGASPRPIDDPIYFDDDDGEYSWVRISDVTSAGTYLSTTEQKLSRLGSSMSVKLKPGALFLSIAGSVGKPCITQIKCCIHDGFVYFPRFKGDAKFLYYLFACGEPYRGLGKLGTQLNLNTDTVGSIVAGFPDPAEQRSIAAFLDRETGRVDRLVAKKRELIERLKEKRTALISRTVTRGLPPAAARAAGLPANPPLKPSGVEWLGDIPEHWQMLRLKNVSARISGRLVYQPAQYFDVEGVPFLMGNNVTERGIVWEDVKFIPEEINKTFSRHALREGDVITVRVGAPGLTCVVPKEAEGLNCGSLMIIRRSPRFDSRWLSSVMNSFIVKTQIDLVQYGAAQEQINITDAVSFSIPTPPLPEQAAIAAYLDEETAKLDALVGKVEEAVERLQEYRTALITAAVTGKIDVRKAAL